MNNIVRHYSDSQEYQRDLIRTAINSKFQNDKGFSPYDIQATFPKDNIVVVKDWDKNEYYEISYTIENNQVTLGEPQKTDHDELYIAQQIAAAKAVKRNTAPVGKGWGPGIHKLFIDNKPVRLLVPKETIKPTFELIQAKLEENKISLGIDHLDDNILNNNKILAKMNLLDVGAVKEVKTNGKDIFITDSVISNPLIHDLHQKGELPALSMVAKARTHECEREDADFVLDEIIDVERFDFVEKGGCQTCKVGAEPTELILASKLSMEVDNMVEEHEETNTENPTDGTNEEEEESQEEETTEEEESTEEESSEEIPAWAKQMKSDILGEVKNTVTGIVTPLVKGETEKVKAKLAEIKENTELQTKTTKVEKDIETKIMAGYATPAMKHSLVAAGVACEDEKEYKKLLASLNTKVWEGGRLNASNHEEEGNPESLDMDAYRKSRKANG